MKRPVIAYSLVFSVLMLSAGMIIGWWLHDRLERSAMTASSPYVSYSHAERAPFNTALPVQRYDSESLAEDDLTGFTNALNDHRIDDALVIYQQYEHTSASDNNPFRTTLKEWLTTHNDEQTTVVLERFTDHYFQDTDLLTLLADHYEQQGNREAAIISLLNQQRFTTEESQHQPLGERIHRLSQTLFDQSLKDHQLDQHLSLFQRLTSSEPEDGFYRFALSQIYLALNDTDSAIRELELLQEHPDYSAQAEAQLASLLPAPSIEEPEDLPAGSIPLVRQNGHHIVTVIAGGRETARLILDTGASLTTLPSGLLQRLRSNKRAVRVSHTQLKTAGGYRFAPIYLLKELQIGPFLVRDIQVAELDLYEPHSEGLLGMDVLGQFQIQLDQDRNTLTLQPR